MIEVLCGLPRDQSMAYQKERVNPLGQRADHRADHGLKLGRGMQLY